MMRSVWDGLDNDRASRRAVAKRLTMKRLSSFTRATPIHENCRRRDVSYRNCIFLGETGNFLALDEEGIADIIRPSHGALRNPQIRNAEPATVDSFRAIELRTTRCGLFSLKDGKAFAIALHDGSFRIYDTENTSSYKFSKDPNAFGVSPAHPGRIGQHFSLQGWTAPGPLRTCARDSSFPLRQQLDFKTPPIYLERNSFGSGLDRGELHVTTSHQVGWDMRETPALNAVHVDLFRDTIAFRFFDERTKKHHTVVNLQPDSDTHILKDVCYCGDYSVASATGDCIMLWDIRMLRNDKTMLRVPAFPHDLVHAMNPSIYRDNVVHWKQTEIQRICCLASGKLLALTKTGFQFIDPIRNRVLKQSSTIPGVNYLTAVDTTFGVVASYNPESALSLQSSQQIVKLYDVYETQGTRKRKHDSKMEIVTSIIDPETDTTTFLTSLSFNSRSDSLVGSSADGNVFVFH